MNFSHFSNGASWHLIDTVNFLLTLVFVSFVLRSKRPAGNTIAWLFFIAVIPYVGIPLYIFLSGRKFGSRLQKKEGIFCEKQSLEDLNNQDEIERLLAGLGAPPARTNSKLFLILSGQEAYHRIIELIKGAQESIYLTTFIFANDSVGREILDILRQKAQQGIKVRLLIDSLGAIWVRNPSLIELKRAGGRVSHFMPLLHIPFRGRSNLRNHRKLLVVDSKKAILGGMNIASEYMGPDVDQSRWVDLALQVEGPSVGDAETIFQKDWEFATGEILSSRENLPTMTTENRLQIVASGPDVPGDTLYDALLTLIFKATQRIWIATPYFIPDEALATALRLAAKGGVDVRILTPAKSNHFLADLARGSYIRQLADSGAKISFYPKMLHAKAFLIDEKYALIGSANFDMRSLLYNFEVGALVLSHLEIKTLESWFNKKFSESHGRLTKSNYFSDLAEGVGRILGPLI